MPSTTEMRPSAIPRRTLHRVDTAALDIAVSLHIAGEAAEGRLLNISAGGCAVWLRLPAAPLFENGRAGSSCEMILPSATGVPVCSARIVGLDAGPGRSTLHLRFRAVRPDTRRALLVYLGELLTGG